MNDINTNHEETVAFAKLDAAYELAFEAYQRLHRVGRFDLSQQLRLDALADVKSQLGKELGEYI